MSSIIIPWQHCVYDSAKIGGERTISLFHGATINWSTDDLHIGEKEIIEFLVKTCTQFLLSLFKLNRNWSIKHHLVEPFTNRSNIPGDIDLLFHNPCMPDKVIAIEVKIFKKKQANFNNGYVSNLDRLRHGIIQAEGLVKLGFHSVYIMPVIISNTSIEVERNLASRSIDMINWDAIRKEYGSRVAQKRVGLAALEICQTSARSVFECGSVSGFVFQSYENEQNPQISEAIKEWV